MSVRPFFLFLPLLAAAACGPEPRSLAFDVTRTTTESCTVLNPLVSSERERNCDEEKTKLSSTGRWLLEEKHDTDPAMSEPAFFVLTDESGQTLPGVRVACDQKSPNHTLCAGVPGVGGSAGEVCYFARVRTTQTETPSADGSCAEEVCHAVDIRITDDETLIARVVHSRALSDACDDSFLSVDQDEVVGSPITELVEAREGL